MKEKSKFWIDIDHIKTACQNPVATSIEFKMMLENMLVELLSLPNSAIEPNATKKMIPYDKRPNGGKDC